MGKITNLTEMSAAEVAALDVVNIVDVSAGVAGSKKITAGAIAQALELIKPQSIYLEHSGTKAVYSTIALAIAAAVSGDKIYLPAGTFNEKITVPSGVSLIGTDPVTTIISRNFTAGEDTADHTFFALKVASGGYAEGIQAVLTDTGLLLSNNYIQQAIYCNGGELKNCIGKSAICEGIYANGASVINYCYGESTNPNYGRMGIGFRIAGTTVCCDSEAYSTNDAAMMTEGYAKAFRCNAENGNVAPTISNPTLAFECYDNSEIHFCYGKNNNTDSNNASLGIALMDSAIAYHCDAFCASYGVAFKISETSKAFHCTGKSTSYIGITVTDTAYAYKCDAVTLGVSQTALYVGISAIAVMCTGRSEGSGLDAIGIVLAEATQAIKCSAYSSTGYGMTIAGTAVATDCYIENAGTLDALVMSGSGVAIGCSVYSASRDAVVMSGTTKFLNGRARALVKNALVTSGAGAKIISGTFETLWNSASSKAIAIGTDNDSNGTRILDAVMYVLHASGKCIAANSAVNIRLTRGVANRALDSNVTITTDGASANIIVDTTM
jgi:hypothetical protein